MLFSILFVAAVFPDAKWEQNSSLSADQIAAITHLAFPSGLARPVGVDRVGMRTNALLIIQNGKIIYENQIEGFTPQSKHLLWSVTKSLLSGWIGVAEQEGYLRRDQLVSDFIPEWKEKKWAKDLRIEHLLYWSSGIEWSEGYEYNPIHSDVVQMLYGLGRADAAQYLLSLSFGEPPGLHHRYSSGDSNLLSEVLRRALGKRYRDYAWEKIFKPLQMNSLTWETDSTGLYIASSYSLMTLQDLARYGLLFARGGRWENLQILSPEFVEYSLNLAPNYHEFQRSEKFHWLHPGAHWWLNRPSPKGVKSWPRAPDDLFGAYGHWGQGLFVIPSKDLIIVRSADDRDGEYRNDLVMQILEVLS